MNPFKTAALCSLMLAVACNGDSTEDTGTDADDSASSENQTQLVAGDSMWTWTTDDVEATTTCTNWAFDCDEANTTCAMDFTGADNNGFSAQGGDFTCSLTGDDFTCTGTNSFEVDVGGDSAVVTQTTDPYGQILSADEMNIVLPISMTCEGDNCSDVTDYLTLPCTVELDIAATRSAE